MKITRKQLREMILEQLGNPSPRFNIKNRTSWQGWVSGIVEDDSVIEDDDEDSDEEDDSESK